MSTERQKLRIGISCYPTFGGSGVVATEIGMEMARRGHKVHFITSDVPRRLDRFIENIYYHEVETKEYPLFDNPPYAIGLASKMVEVVQYEKLDVLHVHYAVPHATSAYLARQVLGKKAPKIITTLHGTDITLVGNDRSYSPITRFSIEQSDGVTAPSQYLRLATYDKLNVSTDTKITVIPNFVDTDAYAPRPNYEKKANEPFLGGVCTLANKILIHISNFRAVKRIEDVIKIFAIVNKQVKSHLVLIGDGPERSKMEALTRELGLKESVCFLGKQESFVRVLQNADVFLLPSESEGFGLAALEALSCGVPVVASNVGGIPEVVQHEETGFLSDVGDVEDMAKHTLNLLQNTSLHKSMSEASRRHVLQHFGQQLVASKYEEFYYSVLGWRER